MKNKIKNTIAPINADIKLNILFDLIKKMIDKIVITKIT